ncbi:MAG: class I SAM-dependent methyltransferase [Chloroflexi bacterium]|nr:class I SAM-dependent methyltransferase [Chloroflexota bacterium]
MTDRNESIEVLSVDLLDELRPVVLQLQELARSLNTDIGWHYLLDLTWIIKHLQPKPGQRILDAGAGTGIMQWFLAQEGVEVLSVDRRGRENLDLHYQLSFPVIGLRKQDLSSKISAVRAQLRQPATALIKVKQQLWNLVTFIRNLLPRPISGKVYIYNQNLKTLDDIEDDSQDAVVSVSALEHNAPDELGEVVAELLRVLKPGGKFLATLGAGRDEDWFHELSGGWNYSEASLREIFELDEGVPSNYEQYDELFTDLQDCAELRENLASFYFLSENNGMPWGKWDPKYIPVGVCKVKK